MKTLADLKRDAKSGKISGEMIIRNGSNNIPETLQGMRKIVDANTVGITFLNKDGKKSELPIKCASLVEYTDELLTVYQAGKRDLNTEEQRIMDEWKAVTDTEAYKNQSNIDALSDGSTTYYQQKRFFENKGFDYLLGFEESKGKKYDFNTRKIRDNSIKGEVSLQYRIYNQ